MNRLFAPRLLSPWRWLAAYALLINAAIHLQLTPMHLEEAPYVGVLFVLLSLGCLVLGGLLVLADSTPVWGAAGGISLLALAAFIASRTVGLPQMADDIGDWSDPYGRLNVAVEVLSVALSLVVLLSAGPNALRRRRGPQTPGWSSPTDSTRQPVT